ncbi:MAG: hypothetical protein PHC86_03240 [Eubacteriales bacterium]|nr:hypothetical protein [Eubacteriales bacterium]
MVLVCVTDQDACDRLIFAGRKLANIEHLDLQVINVRPQHTQNPASVEAVEYLFSISKQLNAEMVILFHDYAPEAVAYYIEHHETNYVIVGMPPDPDQSVFITALEDHFPNLPVISVDEKGALQRVRVQLEFPA